MITSPFHGMKHLKKKPLQCYFLTTQSFFITFYKTLRHPGKQISVCDLIKKINERLRDEMSDEVCLISVKK